jgi:hypothetical protein
VSLSPALTTILFYQAISCIKDLEETFWGRFFSGINWYFYEDSLLVLTPESLISYVLSYHGNQNQYIIDRYNEFRLLVPRYTEKGFRIPKDAGVFISR